MKVASFPLADLFYFPPINGLTEEFILRHQGDVPVYGGRMTGTPIGYIDDNIPNVKYFSDCLAWNREGSVGYVFYHKHKFSTNDHHRPLVLFDKYNDCVDLNYVRIVLQQHLLSQGFVWSKTASKEKVQEMSIELPINGDGKIELIRQREYVEKYTKIENIQKSLSIYRNKINESTVILNKSHPFRTIYLSENEYFNVSIGKRILKKDLNEKGIPAYSANPNKIFGYTEKTNLDSFNLDSIIWGIDGNFKWGFIPKNKVFATTDHCGRLQVVDEGILSEYVFYQLRESSSSYGFNRTYRASLQNIKLVSVDVPVNGKNEFDINAQNGMIAKYKKIDVIKAKLDTLIERAVVSHVEI